jgi:hypothetical protein
VRSPLRCVVFVGLLATPGVLFAMGSASYRIDSFSLNAFGGDATSATYGLTGSGGEEFIGLASSASYRVDAGYIAQLTNTISLTLDSLTVTIPNISPGSTGNRPSSQATTQASVFTDAYGYNLNTSLSQRLTRQGDTTTIPDMTSPAGTISTPAAWTELTTYGLGFTVTGTNAQAKWNSGTSYAAFPAPSASDTIHSPGTYFISSAPDVSTVHYRLAADATQAAGVYQTVVTYSVTAKL